MHEYYHPEGNPLWANDDWIRKNTEWDPDTTPLSTLADNGFYQVKTEDVDPLIHSDLIYNYIWENVIESPYCLRVVSIFEPYPLDVAKQNMIQTYPNNSDEINAATSSEELQEIYNSLQ